MCTGHRAGSLVVWRSLPITLILGLLVGCGAHSSRVLSSASQPGFDSSSFQTVYVLPIQAQALDVAQAQALRRRIQETLRHKGPTLKLMDTDEAVQRLRARHQTQWSAILEDALPSGVFTESTLIDLGQVLGVDAVLQCEVLTTFQSGAAQRSRPQDVVLDPSAARDQGQATDPLPPGPDEPRESVARATVVLRVLDVQHDKLWKGAAEGETSNIEVGPLGAGAPALSKAVQPALDSLLEKLPL